MSNSPLSNRWKCDFVRLKLARSGSRGNMAAIADSTSGVPRVREKKPAAKPSNPPATFASVYKTNAQR
jgi:hypothetical protein